MFGMAPDIGLNSVVIAGASKPNAGGMQAGLILVRDVKRLVLTKSKKKFWFHELICVYTLCTVGQMCRRRLR